MDTIVVGVDGSESATRALDWAAAEARRARAELTIVGAWSYGGHLASVPAPADAARRVVREALARVAERYPEVTVRDAVSEGTPSYVLIDAAHDADLLVVGSRGLGGFRGLLLGSVSQHCLNHAACTVVVVRSPVPATPLGAEASSRRIVVGVDGSPGAGWALRWSVGEARRTGAVLDVIASSVFAGLTGYAVSIETDVLGAARQIARDAQVQVGSQAEDVTVLTSVSGDPPAVALVDASRDADLVVVGAKGHHGLRGLLLGSVSLYVARNAYCPVAVVRHADTRLHTEPPTGSPTGGTA